MVFENNEEIWPKILENKSVPIKSFIKEPPTIAISIGNSNGCNRPPKKGIAPTIPCNKAIITTPAPVFGKYRKASNI